MQRAVLITSLTLCLAAAPGAAESAQVEPAPTPSDGFLDALEQPYSLEDVRAVIDLSDGVNLEIRYTLPDVGAVSIAVHGADDGSGLTLVTVGETVVAELQFAGGSVVSETLHLSALGPADAHAVAASVLQVWHEDTVTEAFMVATSDDRGLKCKVAGGLAGATAGILVGATCGILIKSPTGCGKAAGSAFGYASFYITAKCNGAQNH